MTSKEITSHFHNIVAKLQGQATTTPQDTIIMIGSATCEHAAGSQTVKAEFDKLIKASGRTNIKTKLVGCTGRCSREPIVGVFERDKLNFKYEKVTPEKVQDIFSNHVLEGNPIGKYLMGNDQSDLVPKWSLMICGAPHCNLNDHDRWETAFRHSFEKAGIAKDDVNISFTGCFGACTPKPGEQCKTVVIFPERKIYAFQDEAQIDSIVRGHFKGENVDTTPVTEVNSMAVRFLAHFGEDAFFKEQTRLTLRNSGLICPDIIQDYVKYHGFEALANVLADRTPEQVIEEIRKSGLRGRGGGGYLTGIKWASALEQADKTRFMICNADEGDPGAYMDRSMLEGDPFNVIEGMIIAGYAIQAQKGYFYIRAEYPLAIERIRNAIDQAREAGFLGTNILGSGFSFDLEIRLGAGAFVCGEETALMHSIEGKRGQPRIRPPYPTSSGLWGHPTVINNVETMANVAVILLYGADWFRRLGTESSTGTKVFALAGKIRNSGLVEVPMGTTLRNIIYNIGGGIPKNKALKAIQTGGPSGGCIPAEKLDTPVDYDSLKKIGSIMGSGGMIVFDEEDCMVATARFFLEFTQDESCGKCVPCREGTLRMLEILDRITSGRGEMADIDKLRRLGALIQKSSLCGLGQTAPNPVLSTLDNYMEEFITHITEKRCPAHRCRDLIRYTIDAERCVGCTMCARRCPVNCIAGQKKLPHEIDQSACIKCGECFNACKFNAVIKD